MWVGVSLTLAILALMLCGHLVNLVEALKTECERLATDLKAAEAIINNMRIDVKSAADTVRAAIREERKRQDINNAH